MKSTINSLEQPTLRELLFKIGSLIILSMVVMTSIVQYYSLHEQIINYQENIAQKLDSIFELHKSELLDEIALNDTYSLREHLIILRKENSLTSITIKTPSIELTEEDHYFDGTQDAIQLIFRIKTIYTKHLTDSFDTLPIEIHVDYFKDLMIGAINPILTATALTLSLFLIGLSFTFVLFFLWIKKSVLDPFQQLDKLALGEISRLSVNVETAAIREILHLSSSIVEAQTLREQAAIASTTQMLAHDVRKPFATLTMGLQVLKSSHSKQDPGKILDFLIPHVEKASKEVDGMIHDILQLGKQLPISQEICDLTSLTREALSETVSIARKRGVKLRVDIANHEVYVEPGRIKRVFSNILKNALEEVGHGDSVWISAARLSGRDKGFIKVVIGNSGTHIPPENLERIFDYLYTGGKRAGSGIGLAICRKFIVDHGGSITCKSSIDDQIVEFTMTLPATKADLSVKETMPFPLTTDEILDGADAFDHLLAPFWAKDRDHDGIIQSIREIYNSFRRRIRIGIVDDDKIYRVSLAELLESEQVGSLIDITQFSSAEELLSHKEFALDLVICDFDLGQNKLNGFQAINIYRKAHPASTLIAHSNRFEHQDMQECLSMGADGFILKPMSKAHLLKLIAKLDHAALARIE